MVLLRALQPCVVCPVETLHDITYTAGWPLFANVALFTLSTVVSSCLPAFEDLRT
jgi:hypothetical protein